MGESYQFGTRSKDGILLGLDGGALLFVAVAVAAALVALFILPGFAGVIAAFVVLSGAAGLVLVPIGTRSASDWARVAGSYGLRLVTGRAAAGSVPVAPKGGNPHLSLPGTGFSVFDASDGGITWGLVDAGMGRYVAVMELEGDDFALADDLAQVQALGTWGDVLGSLARRGSPVRSAQIVEIASADDGESAAEWLAAEGHPRSEELLADYEELLGWVGQGAIRHTCYLALDLAPQARGGVDPVGLVVSELASIRGHLTGCNITSTPLDAAALSEVIEEMCYPPSAIAATAARLSGRPRTPLPGVVGWREEAKEFIGDGWHHQSWRVSEWPRNPVPGDWLSPLLVARIPALRILSVHMIPVPSWKAQRQVEHALIAAETSRAQKAKWGFSSHATDARALATLATREDEVAGGHAVLRLSAVLSVASPSVSDLATAAAELEAAASRSRLSLEPCWGQEQAAWIATLPLCRAGKMKAGRQSREKKKGKEVHHAEITSGA